jgi:hypothetical protein
MNWIKENIGKSPSFAPFHEHIMVIEENLYKNPTLCVETCKSLVEGICKTILTNKNIDYSSYIKFQVLVQNTISNILNTEDVFKDDLVELGRRIASVSHALGEIRNNVGFTSHGMDVLNPRLTETISVFAYKIADTIGGFILNIYINNKAVNPDNRIHFEDCLAFNENFDELNPLQFGVIQLSASEALFSQDYEAYKEAYFEYIESLKEINQEPAI